MDYRKQKHRTLDNARSVQCCLCYLLVFISQFIIFIRNQRQRQLLQRIRELLNIPDANQVQSRVLVMIQCDWLAGGHAGEGGGCARGDFRSAVRRFTRCSTHNGNSSFAQQFGFEFECSWPGFPPCALAVTHAIAHTRTLTSNCAHVDVFCVSAFASAHHSASSF